MIEFLNTLSVPPVGTFTPTIAGTGTAGTATYSNVLGKYYIIGKLVFINISIDWSGHTGTGNLTIAGLPIPCPESFNVNVRVNNVGFTGNLVGIVGGSAIVFRGNISGSGSSNPDMVATGSIQVSGFYEY